MVQPRPVIGVFDSGVGGLTVLSRLVDRLPSAHYHYFGDTARVPYGTRSRDTIIDYTRQGLRHLRVLGCELIVVACNTASAVALPILRAEFDCPLIGVVEDGIECAVGSARSGVLVLATRATVSSDVYQAGIRRLRPELEVHAKSCPLFVPLVEEGWADSDVARIVAARYLAETTGHAYDAVVLGCTHYPLIEPALRECLPPGMAIVDPGHRVATRVARLFPALANAATDLEFHVTDAPATFEKAMERIGLVLPGRVGRVHQADSIYSVGL